MSRKRRPEEAPQRPTRMVELDVPGLPGVVITHSYGYDPERAVTTLVDMIRKEEAHQARSRVGPEQATGGNDQAA